MDFSPGRRILQNYWLAIVIVGLLAGVLAFGASYVVSPTYSATTHVLVHQAETRLLTTTGQDMKNQPGGMDPNVAKSVTETESALVNSRPVAEQVVQKLHLDQPRPEDTSLVGQLRKRFKDGYHMALAFLQYGFYTEGDPYEGAISSLQQQLSGTPIKDSYLIEIKARADDPQLTASIADTTTSAFIDASRQRFRDQASQYRSFLQDELGRADASVQRAQQAVQAYKESNGITDISEQVRLSAANQDTARRVLSDTDAALQEAKANYAHLQDTLATLSVTETSTSSVQSTSQSDAPQTVRSTTTVNQSPSASTVQTDSTDLVTESGRSRVTTHSPGTATTTSLDPVTSTTLNETTTSQAVTGQNSQEQSSTAPNRVYQTLQNEAIAMQAQVAGLQAKRDSLAAALEKGVQAATGLPAAQAQLTQLELKATAAQTAYVNLHTTYEQALIQDASSSAEVTLVDGATVPLYPDKPVRYLFALIGLLCGVVGGTGIGYAADNYARRRTGSRLVRRGGSPAPLPGSMPQPVFGTQSANWEAAHGSAVQPGGASGQ